MLTETYCNKVNIQITQRDKFIQIYFLDFSYRYKYLGLLCRRKYSGSIYMQLSS